jgi:hypothetical protein
MKEDPYVEMRHRSRVLAEEHDIARTVDKFEALYRAEAESDVPGSVDQGFQPRQRRRSLDWCFEINIYIVAAWFYICGTTLVLITSLSRTRILVVLGILVSWVVIRYVH